MSRAHHVRTRIARYPKLHVNIKGHYTGTLYRVPVSVLPQLRGHYGITVWPLPSTAPSVDIYTRQGGEVFANVLQAAGVR